MLDLEFEFSWTTRNLKVWNSFQAKVVYAVLLARGELDVLLCDREDVFLAARIRNAGICKVFENKDEAEEFVDRLLIEQERNGWSRVT